MYLAQEAALVNVGSLDRLLRFVVGALLVAAAFVPPLSVWVAPLGNWAYGLTAWGGVMLLTAMLRYCPAYSLLRISTCRADRPS
jgi:Na+-transporting methylmalonyl-CoA/oxaloacetate decarboxylase beta subunit